MTKSRRATPWGRLVIGALMLILGSVLLAYPVAYLLRAPLDDATRAQLTKAGKADHFVSLPLGVMHVRETGPSDGPVVLLVHGSVIGGYAWRDWSKPLADAGYRVITPDLLGYGYSDRPKVPYTRAFYTRQIAELLDALDIHAPVNIVGASMGGAVVTAFAAEMPARVRSVTLIAPAGGGRHSIVSDTLLLPVIGDWVFGVVGPSQMTSMMRKAYPPSATRDALVAWMNEQGRYRGFGEGMLNAVRHYDMLWQPDAYQTLGRTDLPVLVLWGTADTVNPYAQSQQIAAWVPRMKLVSLPGKPHAITFGDAPLLLTHILPFWTQVGAASPAARP